ncbi:MAG TPA: DNA-binding protein [Pseudonocardiaceae bacterium]|nr:DNA-binding protein [Pseudonocardiaceae bacterium]
MTLDPSTPAPDPIALTFADIAGLAVTVDLVTAGRALGIGRTTAYMLARGGEFPCPVLRVGGSYRVPTIGLLRLLGLDGSFGQWPDQDSEHARSGLGLPRAGTSARA